MKLECNKFIFKLRILVFSVILTANMAAQEKSLLIPVQMDGYNLGDAPFTLRIPIIFKEKKDISSFKVQIVAVSREQEHNTEYLESFSPPVISFADDKGISFIETKVNPARLVLPGTYTLHLAIVAADGQQFLAIKLTRPAAKLSSPPMLNIIQESLPFLASSSFGQPLIIEVQGVSPISELKVIQQEFSNVSGGISAAQIEFEPITTPLVSGRPLAVGYELKGDFPLGKNTGKIRLSSPQMAEPLIVNFEVIARRSTLLIFVALVSGLGVGYLLRIRLKEFIERRKAIGKVIDLKEKLDSLAKPPDKLFNEKIQLALNKLKKIQKKSRAADINAVVDDASQTVTTAQNDFEERKKIIVADYNALGKIVELKSQMPSPIDKLIEKFETELYHAKPLLEKEAIEDFQQRIKSAKENLFIKLEDAVGTLVRQTKNTLKVLNAPMAFSKAVAEKVADADKQIQGKISTAETLAKFSEMQTATNLKTGLQAVYEMHRELKSLFFQLIDWLRLIRDETIITLRREKISNEAAIYFLETQSQKLSDFLKSKAATAPDAAIKINEIKPTLADAWREAINEQAPSNLSAEETMRLQKELGEYDYVKAAATVAEFNRKQRREQAGNYLGTKVLTINESNLTYDSFPKFTILPAYQAANAFTPIWTDFLIPEPTSQAGAVADHMRARTRNRAELCLAELLQTIIIGSLIILVGYLVFADTFIGTFKELVLIFFWSFGLDVTLDNFVEKMSGLKK